MIHRRFSQWLKKTRFGLTFSQYIFVALQHIFSKISTIESWAFGTYRPKQANLGMNGMP
jgi:hypothetical protein